MLLNEPPRSAYDLNFRLLGIPVRVHPLFWLVSLFLGVGKDTDAGEMLCWVGAAFVSILIHELGHALMARSYGWEPWITLHGFGGLASYRPTWQTPKSQFLITAAGPGAGFAFAAVIVSVIAATGHAVRFDPTFKYLLPVLWEPYESVRVNLLIYDLLFINIFWGLVNLLPIYPLDGGKIAQVMLDLANPRDSVRQALILSIFTAVLMAILAFVKLEAKFTAIFFAYLAYINYSTLQQTFGGGGGYGGYR